MMLLRSTRKSFSATTNQVTSTTTTTIITTITTTTTILTLLTLGDIADDNSWPDHTTSSFGKVIVDDALDDLLNTMHVADPIISNDGTTTIGNITNHNKTNNTNPNHNR